MLVERTRIIMAEVGIPAEFVRIPVKRIISEIRTTRAPLCGIGWFMTEARQSFAAFTLPIYQDLPMVVLTTGAKRQRLSLSAGLNELMADASLTMGIIEGFSNSTGQTRPPFPAACGMPQRKPSV